MLKVGALRLHWSLLLGAALFCTLQAKPLLLVGYLAVLLVHLFGHALVSGGPVTLHGLGAEVEPPRGTSPLRRSVLAWAGPLAQLALVIAARFVPLPEDLHDAFGPRNLIVALLNL